MSFLTIRSLFERKITSAFTGLSPSVPVMYDNVQEEPPGGASTEYVRLIISYPSLTEPIVSKTESSIEVIRGSVQISCYVPKGKGMKRLEEMAGTAISTLNSLKVQDSTIRASIGEVSGPVNVIESNNPHALVTVSAPFVAKG